MGMVIDNINWNSGEVRIKSSISFLILMCVGDKIFDESGVILVCCWIVGFLGLIPTKGSCR